MLLRDRLCTVVTRVGVCVSVRPRCSSLSWGAREAAEFADVHGDFELLLGADVVFWPDAVPLLLQTVHCFLARRVRLLSHLLTYLPAYQWRLQPGLSPRSLATSAMSKTNHSKSQLGLARYHSLWSPYGIGQTIIFSCCGLFFLLLLLIFFLA